MTYRDTREQLEMRWARLRGELAQLHTDLAEASEKALAVREQQWGALGGWWLRFSLRRALRDVEVAPECPKTLPGLLQAVHAKERALAHGRGVLRGLEDTLKIRSSVRTSESPQRPAIVREAVGLFALFGAASQYVWRPLIVVATFLAASSGEFDGHDISVPAAERNTDPHDREVRDAWVGVGTLALLAVVGGALWWWLQ